MATESFTKDDLFEACHQGDARQIGVILRALDELDSVDLALLADIFDPGDISRREVPFVVKMVRPGRGRPPKDSVAASRRSFATTLGVHQERVAPKKDSEYWNSKAGPKPKDRAARDFAELNGRGYSTVKRDISKYSKSRKRPKK